MLLYMMSIAIRTVEKCEQQISSSANMLHDYNLLNQTSKGCHRKSHTNFGLHTCRKLVAQVLRTSYQEGGVLLSPLSLGTLKLPRPHTIGSMGVDGQTENQGLVHLRLNLCAILLFILDHSKPPAQRHIHQGPAVNLKQSP